MFQIHDRTRRRVAVTVFLLLGVLPTVIVLALGLARKLPGHVRREASRLGTHLGLDVSLTAVGHPRPGVVVYHGLRLVDPETRQVLLRCDRLDARHANVSDADRQSAREVVISASETTVDAAGLDALWELFGRVLRRRTGWPETDVRAAVGELAIEGDCGAWSLGDVEGRIVTSLAEASGELCFQVAGAEMPGTVRVRVARNRQIRPPVHEFTIDTGGSAVPCELLALGLSSFEGLGAASRFQGTLRARASAEGYDGELAGQFVGLDMERLAGERLGHRLSGSAELSIEGARFAGGRLEEAAGTLRAGPGVIGRPLIEAARWLGMTSAGDGAGVSAEYEQLSVAFSLDGTGLRLRGTCAGGGAGVVASGRYGPLVSEPSGPVIPLAALTAALALPDDVSLPATARTAWLLGRLPVGVRSSSP